MAIDRIPGVGPTNADIATAVAAPSAATIAAAVAAPSAAAIVSAGNAAGWNVAGATLAQHQEFSAGNWAWIGRTSFVGGVTDYTISGLTDYKKIRVAVMAQRTNNLEFFLRVNGATSGYNAAWVTEYNNGVAAQVVSNWSIMRLLESQPNQPAYATVDIESPPNGYTTIEVEMISPGGINWGSTPNYGHGKNQYLSTADVSSVTVVAASSGLSTSSEFGISVWGMK